MPNDKAGTPLHEGDRVIFQYSPDSPKIPATIASTKHGYCKDLGLVLVKFETTSMYLEPRFLTHEDSEKEA